MNVIINVQVCFWQTILLKKQAFLKLMQVKNTIINTTELQITLYKYNFWVYIATIITKMKAVFSYFLLKYHTNTLQKVYFLVQIFKLLQKKYWNRII